MPVHYIAWRNYGSLKAGVDVTTWPAVPSITLKSREEKRRAAWRFSTIQVSLNPEPYTI